MADSAHSRRQKVAIVISLVSRPITFEWIADSVVGRDFELLFILLNPGPTVFVENLRRMGCRVFEVPYRSKKDMPRALLDLIRIFRAERPAVVHTHLVDANLAGLTAARICGIPRRIHTRHHSDPYHRHHRHAIFYDRYANFLSTQVVVASDNVHKVLTQREGVEEGKIRKIPFGIKFEEFDSVTPVQIAAMKEKYGATGKGPIVGMVSRYLEIKGLQYSVPAFKSLLEHHPNAYLMMANAIGSTYKAAAQKLLSELPPGSFREIPFENDMPPLYKAMDLFVHVPTDPVAEAFGQAYTESLASRLPSIFTLSGIAREFIADGKNALVVPFQDSSAILQALLRLLRDRELGRKIADQGYQDVRTLFNIDEYIEKLHLLYE